MIRSIINKIIALAVLCLMPLVIFSGCSNANAGIDTLLVPPKLNEQHEQIYQALISAQSSNITLKYPKSGTNLSAFTVEDIDGDGEEEAVVFYEKESVNADESSLRINILDRIDGKWTSAYDYSAEGVELEKIIVSKLGESDRINIIAGYTMINAAEKQVCIYNYNDGVLTNTLIQPYSVVDVRDIDGDSQNELLIIANKNASSDAKARVLKLDNTGTYYETFVDLNENISEFKQLIYGNVDEDIRAIYIDEVVGTNTLQTEILEFSDGKLSILYSSDFSPQGDESGRYRPASHKTMDVDDDGTLEIPVNEVFPGYKDYPETERLYKTIWLVFENNMLVKEYESYYSINDGYAFMFPSRWQGQVTVKIDSINDEVVMYKYDGEITNNMTEIMRIAVVDSTVAEDKQNEGYQVIKTRDEKEYLVRIPQNIDEPLIPTISEVMFNFIEISS